MYRVGEWQQRDYTNSGITSSAKSRIAACTLSRGMPPKAKLQPKYSIPCACNARIFSTHCSGVPMMERCSATWSNVRDGSPRVLRHSSMLPLASLAPLSVPRHCSRSITQFSDLYASFRAFLRSRRGSSSGRTGYPPLLHCAQLRRTSPHIGGKVRLPARCQRSGQSSWGSRSSPRTPASPECAWRRCRWAGAVAARAAAPGSPECTS